MLKSSLWTVIAESMISRLPLIDRITRATSKSLNAKAINHQKMAVAEAKRQRKQAKRLGIGP